MNIAIAGAGVAGSYLGRLLQQEGHKIEIFESSNKKNHWPICAWGAPRYLLSKFSEKAGLNFDDYILYNGTHLSNEYPNGNVEDLNITNLVTYNKQNWEKDLLDGIKITYDIKCSIESFPLDRYDYVIDCTGMYRALLPKPKEDFLVPSYEYLVTNVQGIDEFRIINYENGKGYFWYFPLGKEKGYVGAGDVDKKYFGIKEFFIQHPEAKIVHKIGRPIRLCPPTRMEPFYNQNIIGVGESIGCVFPITGEGIAPSLICCDIFLDTLNKSEEKGNKFDYQQYRNNVLDTFGHYDGIYRILRLLINGKLNGIVEKTGEIKKLLIYEPKAAKAIGMLSVLNELSEGLEYPISSVGDFIRKISNENVPIGIKTINPTDLNEVLKIDCLKRLIPAYYFPISNKEDLVDKLKELFQNLRSNILVR